MRFAALGRTHWLLDGIRNARERGHDPVLIGTCPAAPEYRVDAEDFESLAGEIGCGFFNDTAINQTRYVSMLRDSGAEVALSVNWLSLIGPAMLSVCPHGIVNAHTGDLPRYRGNACPNWAILAGEGRVALTLHKMAQELDAGPILLQRFFHIHDRTYVGDIYRFIDQNLPTMMADLLDGLSSEAIEAKAQSDNPKDGLRCFPRRPEDNQIDWSDDAEKIVRIVRAGGSPFSGAFTHLNGNKLTVFEARVDRLPYPYLGYPGQVVESRRNGEVVVLAGKDVVVLERVEREGEGPKAPAQVIRSTRTRLGLHVTTEIERLKAEMATLREQLDTFIPQKSPTRI